MGVLVIVVGGFGVEAAVLRDFPGTVLRSNTSVVELGDEGGPICSAGDGTGATLFPLFWTSRTVPHPALSLLSELPGSFQTHPRFQPRSLAWAKARASPKLQSSSKKARGLILIWGGGLQDQP